MKSWTQLTIGFKSSIVLDSGIIYRTLFNSLAEY